MTAEEKRERWAYARALARGELPKPVTPAEPVPADLDALRAAHWIRGHLNGSIPVCACGDFGCPIPAAVAELEDARQKVAALEAALRKYGRHHPHCPALAVGFCTCGWPSAARAALAGARPEATEGADDPVRRSSARPEEGP